MISNSDINSDWDDVGWRGIMFDNGVIWMDYDGKIISINYQSEIEKLKRVARHISLQEYYEPVLEWKTSSYHIRIDHLGNHIYRYAVWPIGRKKSEEPDLILSNGVQIPDGNGGNHYYSFKNGNYKYLCYVYMLGSDETPPGVLEVYKDDGLILKEEVIEVVRE